MAPGATHVVVRLPSAGTLLGDALRGHPGARVTSVPARRRGAVVEHLALVEGLPDDVVAGLLLAWNRRYGEPVHVLGESFALRLPVRVEGVGAPGMAQLLRLGEEVAVAGNVASDGWVEQWIACPDEAEAARLERRLRWELRHVPEAVVQVARPRRQDLDCWEVLHAASESLKERAGDAVAGAAA